jgi:hypothetical protein
MNTSRRFWLGWMVGVGLAAGAALAEDAKAQDAKAKPGVPPCTTPSPEFRPARRAADRRLRPTT